MSMQKGKWHRVNGKLVRRRGAYKRRKTVLEAVHVEEPKSASAKNTCQVRASLSKSALASKLKMVKVFVFNLT